MTLQTTWIQDNKFGWLKLRWWYFRTSSRQFSGDNTNSEKIFQLFYCSKLTRMAKAIKQTSKPWNMKFFAEHSILKAQGTPLHDCWESRYLSYDDFILECIQWVKFPSKQVKSQKINPTCEEFLRRILPRMNWPSIKSQYVWHIGQISVLRKSYLVMQYIRYLYMQYGLSTWKEIFTN